jgi:hypothetical protein
VGFYIAYIQELGNLSGEVDEMAVEEPEEMPVDDEEETVVLAPEDDPFAEMGKAELDEIDEIGEEDEEA